MSDEKERDSRGPPQGPAARRQVPLTRRPARDDSMAERDQRRPSPSARPPHGVVRTKPFGARGGGRGERNGAVEVLSITC